MRPTSCSYSTSGGPAAFFQMVTWESRFNLFVAPPPLGPHCHVPSNGLEKDEQDTEEQIASRKSYLLLKSWPRSDKRYSCSHSVGENYHVATLRCKRGWEIQTLAQQPCSSNSSNHKKREQILVNSSLSLPQHLKTVLKNMFNLGTGTPGWLSS